MLGYVVVALAWDAAHPATAAPAYCTVAGITPEGPPDGCDGDRDERPPYLPFWARD